MAITYEWNVKKVDVYPSREGQSNVIYNVHWRLTAMDSELDAEGYPLYVASVFGAQKLDTSDLSNFTNFDSVTSSQVQGWVEFAMGDEELQSLKDGLDAQIDELKNPTSVTKTLVG